MNAGPSSHYDGSLDSLFWALTNRRRRDTLRLLSNHDGSFTLTDLAKMLAMKELEDDIEDIDGDEIKTIRIALYHCHLPKLADCDIITWEGDKGPVDLSERAEAAITLMERVEGSI